MAREHVTFCRICEPHCGMIATVDGDRLTALRPDPEHPLSRGFACPKGIAYTSVQNDPDRVLYPLRRAAGGGFERVGWDEAMTDIAARLTQLRQDHGPEAVSMYLGNPSAFSYSHLVWATGLADALGVTHLYSANSQDGNSRFVASHLLYGIATLLPIPDVDHTELFVVLGANPVVSHGSLYSAPRLPERMHEIIGRGGRVVVIDPRRTETAREFEWVPIVPDSDAWLLLSVLQVLFAENLVDLADLDARTRGWRELARAAAEFAPERTHARTGIDPDTVRALARALAANKSVVYGRTGTCLGRNATLVNVLIDAVNLAAGNLDTPGGEVFGASPIASWKNLGHRAGLVSYGRRRSRIGNLPEVLGFEPAACMAAEMTTPGYGQIKALLVCAGNPVLSVPDGPGLERAMAGLDLTVSLDLYVTETNQHADYILPATAMYEREDFPLTSQGHWIRPFLQATDAVVPPAGEARQEWAVLDELARRLDTRPVPTRVGRLAARLAELVRLPLTPRRMLDALIRLGPHGDVFGLRRGGLSLTRLLTRHPHGIVLGQQRFDRLRAVVRHRDRKMHLDHPEIQADVRRLQAREDDPDFPLRLIGLRELRSANSWLHNVAALRAAERPHAARMHPLDARRLGLEHNGTVRLVSRSGHLELPLLLTEELSRGVVAVPQGWGHRGGWRLANRDGGVNVNVLTSTRPDELDQLAGMSHLNGVPVRAEQVSPCRS